MSYGHKSHQTGLDIDIWFGGDSKYTKRERPKRRKRLIKKNKKSKKREADAKLSKRQRFDLDHPSLIRGAREEIDQRVWSSRHIQLLQIAASQPEVARIFVHWRIKEKLCQLHDADQLPKMPHAITTALEDHHASRSTDSDRGANQKVNLKPEEDPSFWLRKLRPWYGHHQHFHVRLACPPQSDRCVDQGPIPDGLGCDTLTWFSKVEVKARKKSEALKEEEARKRLDALSPKERRQAKREARLKKKERRAKREAKNKALYEICGPLSPSK